MKLNFIDTWLQNPIERVSVIELDRKNPGDDSMWYHIKVIDSPYCKSGMMYNGAHKFGVETKKRKDKIYLSSSTNKILKKIAIDPDSKIELIVKKYGTWDECEGLEKKFADDNNVGEKDNNWFNKWNGMSSGKLPIDYQRIDDIADEIRWIKDKLTHMDSQMKYLLGYQTVKKPIDWLYKLKRLQVRETAIHQKNKNEIGVMIDVAVEKGKDVTDGAKPVIILKDIWYKFPSDKKSKFYDYLVLAGNHTVDEYAENTKTKGIVELDCVFIGPDIHEQFTNTEIHMIGNSDNGKQTTGLSMNVEDSVKECLTLHYDGYNWQSVEQKRRLKELLRSDSWDTIKDKVQTTISDEKKYKEKGETRIAWKSPKIKKAHQEKLNKKNKKNKDVFHCGPFSAAAVKLDTDVLTAYYNHEQTLGDTKAPSTIKVDVYFSTDGVVKTWKSLKAKEERVEKYLYNKYPNDKKPTKINIIWNELQTHTKGAIKK